jgi:hypothetical protein
VALGGPVLFVGAPLGFILSLLGIIKGSEYQNKRKRIV